MMDIVERLREWKNSPLFNWADLDPSDMEEAADEIERLRQQIKQYEDVAYIIDSQGVVHQSYTIVYKEVQ